MKHLLLLLCVCVAACRPLQASSHRSEKLEPKAEDQKVVEEEPIEELVIPTPELGEEDVLVPGMASIDAFKETVWLLTTKYCGGCHSTAISPLHGSSEVEIAHAAVIDGQKVNLVAPGKSRLVKRLAAENHNCWSNCEENAAEMEAAIVQWVEKMKPTVIKRPKTNDVPPPPPPPPPLPKETSNLKLSDAVEMPGEMEGTFIKKLTYDLKPLLGVSGASLEIEVEEFNATSYKFKNPKIISESKIKYEGLQVWVNNAFDPLNATYIYVQGETVPPSSVLSTAALIVLREEMEDLFSIHFDKIETVP